MNRGSSRESDLSSSSSKQKFNSNNIKHKIGDLQLKSNFSNEKFDSSHLKGGNTFIENYSNGIKPSERMKSFNQSQIPLVENLDAKAPPIMGEYNTNSHSINNPLANGYDATYNPDKSKYITQNLRLLKTKMSMSSAASNDSDGFLNNMMANGQLQVDKTPQSLARGPSGNMTSNDYDPQTLSMVSH